MEIAKIIRDEVLRILSDHTACRCKPYNSGNPRILISKAFKKSKLLFGDETMQQRSEYLIEFAADITILAVHPGNHSIEIAKIEYADPNCINSILEQLIKIKVIAPTEAMNGTEETQKQLTSFLNRRQNRNKN